MFQRFDIVLAIFCVALGEVRGQDFADYDNPVEIDESVLRALVGRGRAPPPKGDAQVDDAKHDEPVAILKQINE